MPSDAELPARYVRTTSAKHQGLPDLQQLDLLRQPQGSLIGTLLLLSGIALVRSSWMRRNGGSARRTGGWVVIAAGLASFAYAWGGEVGTVYALVAFSAVAYVVVAMGVELRPARAISSRDIPLEPEDRAANWPRAIAKSLLAIVLAGVAAIGIGVAFAVAMPLAAPDRIVIGGLLVPMLWGAGMAWTLSDAKLLRATILLGAISALAYGIAFLPKVLAA